MITHPCIYTHTQGEEVGGHDYINLPLNGKNTDTHIIHTFPHASSHTQPLRMTNTSKEEYREAAHRLYVQQERKKRNSSPPPKPLPPPHSTQR